MQRRILNKVEIEFVESLKNSCLKYSEKENVISGSLYFNMQYRKLYSIADTYEILIDLNRVSTGGVPEVRETEGRILNYAISKKMNPQDWHLEDSHGKMCIIIPPQEKEIYPHGFDIVILIDHIQKHLYWISYFEKYGIPPWKGLGHGDYGYLDLYISNPSKYKTDVKKYFKITKNSHFRKKIKELKKLQYK